MKNLNLYIYCAGGFGKEVFDIAISQNFQSKKWNNIFFIDDILEEKKKYGTEVFRFDDLINNKLINNNEFRVVIANGEPFVRAKILDKLKNSNLSLDNVIHPSSVVSNTSQLCIGSIVAPLCSIQSDSIIGSNSCINTMSIVGHDVEIGENTVISSMVNLGGGCIIGESSYVGMGALIKEGIKIGANSIIGMGSVVYNDVPNGMIALGNPARVIRENTDKKVFK
jgi:sugar O-acyltransferase (sialic acid O-acetyltransferase NeuD family)